MPAPDVEVVSFGCRLNLLESAAIERMARASGQTNLVVVNTCAVTAEAVKQARQSIRRIARERAGVEIVVTGCGAEAEPARFEGLAGVTRLVPNARKAEPSSWGGVDSGMQSPVRALSDAMPGRTRAFVQVQNGCDHNCTFCIIPAGRGRARSVPPAEVVEAVARLVGDGVPEVVLTGVDLTSWGVDLDRQPRLGALVQAILRGVPALRRLRLSSIDSIEADAALIDAFASEMRLMPHLHLSLQAGDDLILKRMKRRHLFEDATRICSELRTLRPDIVFGADIIAGFPTETEAMFQRSLDLVEACGLTYLHVFPYSPRPGSPAARMPQVAPDVAKQRAKRLRAAGDVALRRHLDGQIGRRVEVLAENGGHGRCADFTTVRLPQGSTPGQIFDAVFLAHDGRVGDVACASRLVDVLAAE